MKIWKKLMVFATALLLISAILAAQFVSVQTSGTLGIDIQYAGLQIAASDPAIAGNSTHNYTLERDGSAFTLNLGTWGSQNTFRSSHAFLIVNAGASTIKITNCTVTGDIAQDIRVYLHDGYQGMTPSANETSVLYWDRDYVNVGSGDVVYLISVATPYPTDYLNVTEDTGRAGSAEWKTSTTGGDSLWVYNSTTWGNAALEGTPTGNLDGFSKGSAGTTNAVWVYIEVDPQSSDGSWVTGTLQFFVEDA